MDEKGVKSGEEVLKMSNRDLPAAVPRTQKQTSVKLPPISLAEMHAMSHPKERYKLRQAPVRQILKSSNNAVVPTRVIQHSPDIKK